MAGKGTIYSVYIWQKDVGKGASEILCGYEMVEGQKKVVLTTKVLYMQQRCYICNKGVIYATKV